MRYGWLSALLIPLLVAAKPWRPISHPELLLLSVSRERVSAAYPDISPLPSQIGVIDLDQEPLARGPAAKPSKYRIVCDGPSSVWHWRIAHDCFWGVSALANIDANDATRISADELTELFRRQEPGDLPPYYSGPNNTHEFGQDACKAPLTRAAFVDKILSLFRAGVI